YSICSANTRGLPNVLPQVAIAPTDANKNEGNAGNTSFTFTVTRTGLLGATFTLNYAVTGSGANPADAADFGGTFPSGMVSFAANETSKVITVLVSGDLTVEPDETFTTSITQNGGCAVQVTTGSSTGTILNDDMLPLPVISIAATDATKNEGNAGTTNFLFTLTRTGDLSAASSVNYTVTGSGANPADAADFGGTFPTGTVNFAIGESSKPLNIGVSGDMSVESDEGFTVTLSIPVNATIGTGSATGTIFNDDIAGYTYDITDPCSCNNNATPNNQDGTFGEEVTVMGPPNMNLVVGNGSTGLIGVSIGDPIPETPLGSGTYILSFEHLDAVGYTLNVADTDPANLIPGLTISNTCYYPVASIDGLPTIFCEGDPAVTLMGSAQLGGVGGPANGVGEFFVDGSGPVTMFDPAAPGTYEISFVFDATDNDPNAQHPGCISTVTQDVTVNDTPDLSETHMDVTCTGGMDGSIDLTISGVGPFDILWSNGAMTEDLMDLSAGNYTVSVTANNCQAVLSVTIMDGVDNEIPDITCPDDITLECDEPVEPPMAPMMILQYDPVGPQLSNTPLMPAFASPGISGGDLSQVGFGVFGNGNVWPVGLITNSPVVPVGNYLTFALSTANAIQLTTIQYDKFSYFGDGPSLASVRSSLDGFAMDIATVPVNPVGGQSIVFDVSGMAPISGAVTFRIYFYAAPTGNTDWCDLMSSATGANGLRVFASMIVDPATAMDNCDPFPLITWSDTEDYSGCGGYTGNITRTWRATDDAGNTAECDQVITIVDTTPPTWDTDPLPMDMTVECDAIPDPETLTASDNCTMGGGGMNVLFINELHYDNSGADVNEFIEVAGTAGLDLTGYTIVWYNGSNGQSYGTTNLSGVIDDEGLGAGALSFAFAGIQNGSPDGMALVDPSNNVLQFLSYEGAFTATNGPANGMMSTDIGVQEAGADPAGLSLQLTGTGMDYPDFVWNNPAPESPGSINDGQEFGANPPGPGVTIEFVQTETPGSCLNQYTLTRTWTATDECDNAVTHTQVIVVEDTTPPVLSALPADQTVECDQVPTPPAVTAMDNCDMDVMVQFAEVRTDGNCPHNYSLARTWTATDDCDNSTVHTQTITVQDTQAPVFDGPLPQDVTVECTNIPEALTLTATDNCTDDNPDPVIFINEFHYDNTGGDVGEFIEVAGTAGLDLSNYSLVLYNGSNGLVYNTLPLFGTIDDEGNGTGAVSFPYPVNGIQNGAPDGIALVEGGTNVLYFLSYEGTFTALDGPANGLLSTDIGVLEVGGEPIGLSLQLTGSGMGYNAFTWSGPSPESPGDLNDDQDFNLPPAFPIIYSFSEVFTPGACLGEGVLTRTWTATDACGNTATHTQTITIEDNTPPSFDGIPETLTVECDDVPPAEDVFAADGCGMGPDDIWINELHYDNVGVDANEFFEIAGPAGFDLTGYIVYLYNGANGLLYNTIPLTGVIDNEGNGYGALAFVLPVNGIQNGSPDGLALVGPGNTLIQFLSYEGAFTAVDGPIAGATSTDIGVSEIGNEPLGLSLQLIGVGNMYTQFAWAGPLPESPGSLNVDQGAGPILILATVSETIIPGNCTGNYTIERTYTATDDCGNEAMFVQVITVEDTTPPDAQCQDITVFLDENGIGSFDPQDLDNGSSDNCGTLSFSAMPSGFTC
ncbi:MAG TPA: Calx-beta domain-containing protein, partial [Saprospiraceae bacterium]|nr:Calx-beta domain-containing protein [Saprospiraceae bacterium]